MAILNSVHYIWVGRPLMPCLHFVGTHGTCLETSACQRPVAALPCRTFSVMITLEPQCYSANDLQIALLITWYQSLQVETSYNDSISLYMKSIYVV